MLTAACWAVLTVLLLVSPAPERRLVEAQRGRVERRSWGSRGLWLVTGGLVLVLVALTLGSAMAACWTALVVTLAATAGELGLASLRARREARRRRQVQVAAQVVASQLRAGSLPRQALVLAARECSGAERAAATIAIGGDVGRALRDAGMVRGQEGLASLGRAWTLGEGSGAPMADLAERVSQQVREDDATRSLVAAELAAPRASSRLLALLPALGLAMGSMTGGDPVGFLLGTLPGMACLLGGVVLACAGLVWSDRMARDAEAGS